MSKLTLDEAIKRCLEVAEQKEHDSITTTGDYELDVAMKEGCMQCAADHRQLAEWLTELKNRRAEQNDQYIFIHELMTELKEAKRLLKVAMEDMKILYESGRDEGCVGIEFKWRYANEALKLIGDESSGV